MREYMIFFMTRVDPKNESIKQCKLGKTMLHATLET